MMETSTSKRIRTHGPNTSAVLHATGDLRLVSSARCHGVSWVLVDSEYSFSNVVVFAFIFSFLIQEERPVPTPEKGGTRVHSCQLRRMQTTTALCKTNHRMCDQYNPVSCEWARGGGGSPLHMGISFPIAAKQWPATACGMHETCVQPSQEGTRS